MAVGFNSTRALSYICVLRSLQITPLFEPAYCKKSINILLINLLPFTFKSGVELLNGGFLERFVLNFPLHSNQSLLDRKLHGQKQ